MKKLFIALLAFFLFVPSVAAQIPVAGEEGATANETQGCGTLEFPCEMIMFINSGPSRGGVMTGSMSFLSVQRMEMDDGYRSLFMSDMGAMEFFDGFGFYNYKDYTARYDLMSDTEATPTANPITYRVFEGKSDVLTEYEDTTIYFLNVPDEEAIYVVIAIDPQKRVVNEFVESIIAGEDWTEEPEGYFVFAG